MWTIGVTLSNPVSVVLVMTLTMLPCCDDLVVIAVLQVSLYQMLYCGLSFIGLRWNYFFFSIHLLDFVMNFKLLRTVLRSVLHNGKQVY